MEREIAGETSIFVSLDDVQRAPGRQERLLPERGRPRPLFFAERLLSERGRPRPLFFRNAYFRNAGVLARSFFRTPTLAPPAHFWTTGASLVRSLLSLRVIPQRNLNHQRFRCLCLRSIVNSLRCRRARVQHLRTARSSLTFLLGPTLSRSTF